MARQITVAFAIDGDRVEVPVPPQVDGQVSYETGYTFDYSRPVSDPLSKNFERLKFNALMHDVTGVLQQFQQQGAPEWYVDTPYAQFARVKHEGSYYVALVEGTEQEPGTGGDWTVDNVAAQARQNNLTATTDPTVNDDETEGYEPLSQWINTSSGEIFVAISVAAGAADWQPGTLSIDELGNVALLNANAIGQAIIQSPNPGAIRFLRANADNSVSWISAAELLAAVEAAAVQSVATIADLLALSGVVDGQKIEVGGCRVDGVGGGIFTYRAGVSRSTHNGGTVIASNATWPDWSNYTQVNDWFNFTHASNGCWVKEVKENQVDIKEFGALGDDNNLIDGRIWTAALRDHNLFLSDGIYTMSFRSVPSNRTVTGSGYNAILKHPPTDFSPGTGSTKILLIQERSNITLHNFRVDGNKSEIIGGDINNCEGISIDTCGDVNVDLVWAENCYSEGIDIDTSTNCVASRIFARGCGGMAVHLSTACVRCFTRNSFAVECGIDGQRPAFDTFQTTTDSGVQNCVAADCFAGFNIHGEGNTLSDCQTYNSVSYGLYTDYSDSCTISNLTIDGALSDGGAYAGYAVLIRGNGGKIGGLQIKNINSPGRGIEINGSHNKINGGSISGAAGNVIVISRTMTYLPSYNSISNISIDGGASISDTGEYNKMRNIDRNAPTAVAFQLLGRGGKVQNCSTNGDQEGFHVLPITDTVNTGEGYTLSGCVHDGNPSVAFRLSSGTVDNTVIGCHAPNSAQQLVNAGTGNKVSGGTGMLGGRRAGTFAGNGGGTSILIPHGFPYAPQWANVYPNSADAVDTFYSLTLGGTNITVTFTSARPAGTGNVSMRWEAGTNID